MSSEAAPADTPSESPPAIDALPVFRMDGTRASIDARTIVAHDFHSPAALPQSDLRLIDALYQRCVRQLATRLSAFLRMECALKIATLTSFSFSKFRESMAQTSCVTLFGVEEMRGAGILDMSLPLALSMSDRLLGGKGRAPTAERPLTEIELALLEDAMQIIFSGWSDLWASPEQHLHSRFIGNETSGRSLQTAPADEMFVVVIGEMSIGETVGQFQISVPFAMIEFAVRKMAQERLRAGEDKRSKPVQWRTPYAGIAVPVFAEWKVREMSLAETLRISKGDVIELPGALINHARLRVSEVETYVGTVGIQNGHVAVQITGHSSND